MFRYQVSEKKRTAEHRTRNNECRRKKTSSFDIPCSIFDIQNKEGWLVISYLFPGQPSVAAFCGLAQSPALLNLTIGLLFSVICILTSVTHIRSSFHNFGMRMLFHPLFPLGICRGQPGKLSLKKNALDTHQPIIVRIPQRTGFFIVQDKGAFISPA